MDERKPAEIKFEVVKNKITSVNDKPTASIYFRKYKIGFIQGNLLILRMRNSKNEPDNKIINTKGFNFESLCEYVTCNSEEIFYKYDLYAKVEIEKDGGFIKPNIVEYF